MPQTPDRPTAAELARIARAETAPNAAHQGEVYLVGAGPGDPELLTLRALKLMERAEVMLYDNLVSDAVLELVPASVERIYVGKRRADHTLRQEEINALLVRHARAGRRVLRLKGGDPFMFGRGGEEIDSLAANGIPFEVVPGITAALGVAAFAGIPLTHRDYAQACLFVTGHLKDGSMDLDWPALARPRQTVVVYMGLLCLPILCAKLIEHGQSPDLPAAVVQHGTALLVTERTFKEMSVLVQNCAHLDEKASHLFAHRKVIRIASREQLATEGNHPSHVTQGNH